MCLAAQAPSCSVQGLPSLLWPEGSSLLAVARGVFPPCCGLWGLPSLFWPAGSSVFAVVYGVFPPCYGLRGLPSLLWPLGSSLAAYGLFVVRRGIWFPDQEWNPGNPAFGAWSLCHWTIRKVPLIDFVYLLSLVSFNLAIIT